MRILAWIKDGLREGLTTDPNGAYGRGPAHPPPFDGVGTFFDRFGAQNKENWIAAREHREPENLTPDRSATVEVVSEKLGHARSFVRRVVRR